jgi:hypothetical protein
MSAFDYEKPAELFISQSKGASRRPMTYRRFATAAEAICYAIEKLPTAQLAGTILQAGENRFDHQEIRDLYDRSR